ncbi:hypothetical protein E2C01_053184 [Portunus trituberculatus]|uniref:Uncharacterized protein n=1 Tax=Portunus trituberculatus TaxID=210409 RepID=A0A5B7GNH5_PORTR|nr:hypothetical protein [Portunus trituberculatus]
MWQSDTTAMTRLRGVSVQAENSVDEKNKNSGRQSLRFLKVNEQDVESKLEKKNRVKKSLKLNFTDAIS